MVGMSVPPRVVAGPPRSGAAKQDVVSELGERVLLLPSLVNRGLEANDRAKYLLTLLQAARSHADEPAGPFSSLRDERLAAGIADEELGAVVGRSRRAGEDVYVIPGVRDLHDALAAAVAEMLAPLAAAGARDRVDPARLDALVRGAPNLGSDRVPGSYIERIASGDRARGDSWHLLVMDAHKRHQRARSPVGAGDHRRGAGPPHRAADRPRIRAFMAGLKRTAPLAFGHPGLGTTAARAGLRLTIQNDIGETDTHVIVIHVEGAAVTHHLHRRPSQARPLLHVDVRDKGCRLEPARREQAHGMADDVFHLITGRHAFDDEPALLRFLEPSGLAAGVPDRLEQGARKALQNFLGKQEAVEILPGPRRRVRSSRFPRARRRRPRLRGGPRAGAAASRTGARLDALWAGGTREVLRRVLRRPAKACAPADRSG